MSDKYLCYTCRNYIINYYLVNLLSRLLLYILLLERDIKKIMIALSLYSIPQSGTFSKNNYISLDRLHDT